MKRAALTAILSLVIAGHAYAESTPTGPASAQPSIPYVATRSDTVRDLLWLAEVSTNDVVYDLGSGDGRIAIAAVKDFGARKAVGIENDPARFQQSVEAARQAGVANRVELIHGDLFTNDVSEASVVVVYLGHDANLRLRPSLVHSLKPGSRVVSHQYSMGEWPPDKQLKVRSPYLGMYSVMVGPFTTNPNVPDYRNTDTGLFTTLSLWVVPAGVAGVWRGSMQSSNGLTELELRLQQRLGYVTGQFALTGTNKAQGSLHADLWGDHLRFEGHADEQPYFGFRLMFDGHAEQDAMTGKLAVFEGAGMREVRCEARRERSDLTGIWQWPAADHSTNVTLHVVRKDGALSARYNDSRQESIVTDIYDFGGGFYFTLLLGRENHAGGGYSLQMDRDCGWLLGSSMVIDQDLRGTLSFYPCPDSMTTWPDSTLQHESAATNPPARRLFTVRDWNAKRLQP